MSTAITPVPPPVTLVTALAEATDLSDADYRAIYQRVAAQHGSLRKIRDALDPERKGVTHGWWANYANGDVELDRARKNELRAWAGLPALPPTVADAVADAVHPDAAVYRVGQEIASRVVLIGADVPAVNLRLNGNCGVIQEADQDAHVTPVTAYMGRENNGMVLGYHESTKRQEAPCFRPRLSLDKAVRRVQLLRLLAECED